MKFLDFLFSPKSKSRNLPISLALIIPFQCAVDHIAVDSDEARKCLNEGQFLYCF